MTRRGRIAVFALDALVALAAYALAAEIRFLGDVPDRNLAALMVLAPFIAVLHGLARASLDGGPAAEIRRQGVVGLLLVAVAWVLRDLAGAVPTTVLLLGWSMTVVASRFSGAVRSRAAALLHEEAPPLEGEGPLRGVAPGFLLSLAPERVVALLPDRDREGLIRLAPEIGLEELGSRLAKSRPAGLILGGDAMRGDPDRLLAILYLAEAQGVAVYAPDDPPGENPWIVREPDVDRPFFRIRTWRPSPGEYIVKRCFDVSVTLMLLPIVLPALGALAFLIRRESPGPAFYRQERVGERGRAFSIVKLRTMPVGVEEATGPIWAEEDDPRATPLGKRLRRLGLDELPQLLHVLAGRMSLIGPRPERGHFTRIHPELLGRRLLLAPGLTGLAQIRLGKTADVAAKARYDEWYIRRRSLALDVEILLETAGKLAARLRERPATSSTGEKPGTVY